MEFLKYVVDLVGATLFGIFLTNLVVGKDPVTLGLSITTGVVVAVALTLHAVPYLPHRTDPAWQEVTIGLDEFSPLPPKKYPPDWASRVVWKDIYWLSKSRGWLAGAVAEGGGHDDVGTGILLFSYGGPTWNLVPNLNFNSGSGEFTWGPAYMGGTRLYRWDDVGPIYSIQFYRGPALEQGIQVEGWAATATGVYRSTTAGQAWTRSTPAPNSSDRERYAFYSSIAGVEGFAEVYAVGWQGIAHWSAGADWRLEKPAYFYNISAIVEVGGSENRNVWAVGRSGRDELGWGDKSHGAIFHLAWPENQWKAVDLSTVSFRQGQGFQDLIADDHKVVAVGDGGLMVVGTSTGGGQWAFRQIDLPTKDSLSSIAEYAGILYAVGQNGTILFSRDGGSNWTLSKIISDVNGNALDVSDKGFTRIRFFNDEGWILGNSIVLKSTVLASPTWVWALSDRPSS
jgi:hypothetical protein